MDELRLKAYAKYLERRVRASDAKCKKACRDMRYLHLKQNQYRLNVAETTFKTRRVLEFAGAAIENSFKLSRPTAALQLAGERIKEALK